MATTPQTSEPKQKTGTVRLHRIIRAPPERVYKAFLDADAMAKWLPPKGFTGKVHSIDARVGGGYKMSFTNFGHGVSHSFGATYVELTPHTRIRYVTRFDDPNMPGEMAVTVDLKPVMTGTEVTILQEGIPAMVPVEFATMGWQESLEQLMALVEPDIPAGA
ncbi:MAG TPA: SRPBCC family protein [Candidatus Thermoplasmatota archaeon]|nr:SRPBCC family protein [Candidatus Thermoplasmatota archaeon]